MDYQPEQVAFDLARFVRGDVYTDILHRVAYSTDASIYRVIPLCVVAPRDRDDVVAVTKYARGRKIPIVARGAGTGLAGESLCNGIVFDMARHMNGIVDSGVTTCELMDGTLINLASDALPEYRDILPAGAAAVLLLEHTGQTSDQVSEKIETTDAAVGNMAGGRSVFFDPEQQKRLWKARKDAGPLLYRNRSKKHPAEFMEDVSVDHN